MGSGLEVRLQCMGSRGVAVFARDGCTLGSSGKVMQKVVPAAEDCSSSSRPPRLETVLRAEARPSPVPTGSVVKKGSKIRLRIESGIPPP